MADTSAPAAAGAAAHEIAASSENQPQAASAPTLRPEVIAELCEDVCARVCAGGAMIVPATRDPGHMLHVPFALLPRKLPRACFQHAMDLAKPFNELVHAIARDPEWLLGVLSAAGAGDEFTGRLMSIYRTVRAEGIRQPIVCGSHRSDYMVDRGATGDGHAALRQVELNTISSGFAALALRVAEVHRYMLSNHGARYPELVRFVGAKTPDDVAHQVAERCPASQSLEKLPAAIALSHQLYGGEGSKAVVAFLVQQRERNIMDQRQIEHAIWDRHRLRSRRVTHSFIGRVGRLREHDGALLLPKECVAVPEGADAASLASSLRPEDWDEVSVVYFRSGYTPDDYPSELEWSARLMIERSRAIKCPNILYHLAGAKKVQQALAMHGAVERFLPADKASAVRSCFAGLWSLDKAEWDADAIAAVEDAKAHPERYVVKPQREGGGNNLYNEAVRTALSGGMSDAQLAAHILMQRIYPRVSECILVKNGLAIVAPAVSELGIFSVFVGDVDTGAVHMNDVSGFLLRTKGAEVDEGGVAAGFAVIDSPLMWHE